MFPFFLDLLILLLLLLLSSLLYEIFFPTRDEILSGKVETYFFLYEQISYNKSEVV